MAIGYIEPSRILEAQLGWRGSYINDALIREESPQNTRIEISERMADALLKLVGWTTEWDPSEKLIRMGNKDYVCVLAGGELAHRRLFVYQHDFSWYLYEVEGRS